MKRQSIFWLQVLALLLLPGRTSQADAACGLCGSTCGVRKVCRLVCEKKKIEDFCYGCECEDYCLPGRSCRGCLNTEDFCAQPENDGKGGFAPLCRLEWFDWKPTCAQVRTRTKLVKYVIEKEIPSYKWVVVEACACGGAAAHEVKPAPAEAKVGDEFPLTDDELKRVPDGVAQASAVATDGKATSSRRWWPNSLSK